MRLRLRLRPETKRRLLKDSGWLRQDRTCMGRTEECWKPPLEPDRIPSSVSFATAWRRYQKEHP